MPVEDPRRELRLGVYALLIMAGTGAMLGRILAVNSVDNIRLEKYLKDKSEQGLRKATEANDQEGVAKFTAELARLDWQKQRPFLSGNDRSRWCTVRSLVEFGTYAIDDVVSQRNWDTIDMVKHDDLGRPAPKASEGHLYSSKPPLLATLMAGEYWLIHKMTGATLGTHPYSIGRAMLVTVNVLPLLVYFVLLAKLAERLGTTDWGRIFYMFCATCGTYLTTFAIVVNNHLPGAVSVAVALHALVRIWYDGRREGRYFAAAGLGAAFAATCELPAASFLALVSLLLLWRAPRQTLIFYVPVVGLVASAYFGTNYLAHHSLRMPYDHRAAGDNWYDYQYQFPNDKQPRQSYWSTREKRSPIDQGEPSTADYCLHVLVGHHGIFSLTPIWLISLFGMVRMGARREPNLRMLGWLALSISTVCVAFYVLRPLDDRNYGGMTSGFRWAFWLTPLWLLGLLAGADAAAGRRLARALCAFLLACSVLSVAYPTWNPWTNPWILDFLLNLEWVKLGIR